MLVMYKIRHQINAYQEYYICELSKRKHNKQKRIILCDKGKTTHIESIAYLGIKKLNGMAETVAFFVCAYIAVLVEGVLFLYRHQ